MSSSAITAGKRLCPRYLHTKDIRNASTPCSYLGSGISPCFHYRRRATQTPTVRRTSQCHVRQQHQRKEQHCHVRPGRHLPRYHLWTVESVLASTCIALNEREVIRATVPLPSRHGLTVVFWVALVRAGCVKPTKENAQTQD